MKKSASTRNRRGRVYLEVVAHLLSAGVNELAAVIAETYIELFVRSIVVCGVFPNVPTSICDDNVQSAYPFFDVCGRSSVLSLVASRKLENVNLARVFLG